MRSTLCALLAGLSLIPSTASPKIPESRMDPLVVKIVELLKADPTTSRNLQDNWKADFSRHSTDGRGSAYFPAKSGTLITYSQQFREGDKTIIIGYFDNDDKNFKHPDFQSDGIIGPADSLTININYDSVRGKKHRSGYELRDYGLDRKLDVSHGDVLELGVSSDEASDYFYEKSTEIDQKYTNLLKEMENRLTKKKE